MGWLVGGGKIRLPLGMLFVWQVLWPARVGAGGQEWGANFKSVRHCRLENGENAIDMWNKGVGEGEEKQGK